MNFLSAAEDAGRTSAEFLTIPAEAQSAGMGEAYSAQASGSAGVWYNPATVSRKEVMSLSLMHAAYFEGVALNTLSLAVPFGRGFALGFGFEQVSYGSISSYDNAGQSASSYSPKEMQGRLTFGKTFSSRTSIGLSGSMIRSTIDSTADTLAFGAGIHQAWGPVLLSLAHDYFGGSLKYAGIEEDLPESSRAALSCRLFPGFTLASEAVQPKQGEIWYAAGAEYRLPAGQAMDVSLRAGYNTRVSQELGSLGGLSAGTSFGFRDLTIHYAWVPFGELGQTHRFSTDFEFDDWSSGREERLRGESQKALLRLPTLKKSDKHSSSPMASASLAGFPWKTRLKGARTSQERVMDLLARDALCTSVSPQALITKTRGGVLVNKSPQYAKWLRAKTGQFLFDGDQLRTSPSAYAQVVFANGTKAEVGPNALVQVQASPSVCERAIAVVDRGDVYAFVDDGSEFQVKTPLGEVTVGPSQSEVGFDGDRLAVCLIKGTGTFSSDGKRLDLKEGILLTKSKDGAVVIAEAESRPPTPLISSDPKNVPGRWDKPFSETFKSELQKLDSVPGLALSEYVLDTNRRDQLKLAIFDMKNKQLELNAQAGDYQQDIDGFSERVQTLLKEPSPPTKLDRQQRRLELKQTRVVLSEAQKSLTFIQKELKSLLTQLRLSQEYLAATPIVRLLNITAQESTIPFESSRALIPPEAYPTLDTIAESAVKMNPYRIVIEGHTDKTGSAWVNQRLSKRRAEAVAQYLQRKTNIPLQRFITKGMGFRQPLVEGDDLYALAKNRRVEIWFELRGL